MEEDDASESQDGGIQPLAVPEGSDAGLSGRTDHILVAGQVQSVKFTSPLPPASELRALEEILPGAANQLMNMATKEQEHRHETDWFQIRHIASMNVRGLNYALAVTILFLVVCVIFAVLGYATQGIILGGIDLVTLVTIFILRGAQGSKD